METWLLAILLSRCDLDNIFDQLPLGLGELTVGFLVNLLVLFLGVRAFLRSTPPVAKFSLIVWGPYIVLNTFSLLYAPDLIYGLKLLMVSLTSFSVFTLSAIFSARNNHIRIYKTVIYSSLIPVIYGYYSLYFESSDDRLSSTFAHANIFAFYLVAILYSIMNITQINKNQRYANIIQIGTIGYASLFCLGISVFILLLASQCRSAWAASVILLSAYALFCDRRILIASVVVPFIFFIPSVNDRITDVSSGSGEQITIEDIEKGGLVADSYSWRKLLWRMALEDAQKAPLLGQGVGSFHVNSIEFFPVGGNNASNADAHSAYVQTFYELGYIGFAAYVWIFLSISYCIFRHRDNYILPIFFIVANAMMGYSDNVLSYISFIWYSYSLLGAEVGWRLAFADPLKAKSIFMPRRQNNGLGPIIDPRFSHPSRR